MKGLIKKIFIILAIAWLQACSWVNMLAVPKKTYYADSTGQFRYHDTPEAWREHVWSVDASIIHECAGRRAYTGKPGNHTWAEYWALEFDRIKKCYVDSGKFIDYIIKSRREAHLPELGAAKN
jgi:hypothetical protein